MQREVRGIKFAPQESPEFLPAMHSCEAGFRDMESLSNEKKNPKLGPLSKKRGVSMKLIPEYVYGSQSPLNNDRGTPKERQPREGEKIIDSPFRSTPEEGARKSILYDDDDPIEDTRKRSGRPLAVTV